MRVFGIDPGSERTGYGCVETDGRRHRLIVCGAVAAHTGDDFPPRLARIHRELTASSPPVARIAWLSRTCFYATNVRSALKLGTRAAWRCWRRSRPAAAVAEYTPAEVKRAVVGYGRAEKTQVQQMVKVLLGLDRAPSPHDAADALAVAICHVHEDAPTSRLAGRSVAAESGVRPAAGRGKPPRSWRQYRPPAHG